MCSSLGSTQPLHGQSRTVLEERKICLTSVHDCMVRSYRAGNRATQLPPFSMERCSMRLEA